MSQEIWPNALPPLLLVLLRYMPSRVLIGIEFIPSEIWVTSGRVIVRLCSITQIVVIVNTLNRYKTMLRHIGDKWAILLITVMWIVVIGPHTWDLRTYWLMQFLGNFHNVTDKSQ